MTVHQQHGNEHRILKEFFVSNPKLLDDLIEEQFAPYYKEHRNKRILLYYGHDGNKRQINSKLTLAQEAEALLKSLGWKVRLMSKGAHPTHLDRYLVLNSILKENNPLLPLIRINEYNCPNLIISMENAGVVDGGTTALHKDKSSERSTVIKQQHATHLSDTFDTPIYAMYHQKALRSMTKSEYRPITAS